MKKLLRWPMSVALALLAASFLTYALLYLAYHNLREILLSFINNIAFLFIYVLVVMLVIEQLLAKREKRVLMKKLNMVIGTFFSAVGLDMLKKFRDYVTNADALGPELLFSSAWQEKDFERAMAKAKAFSYKVRVTPESLGELRRILGADRTFLLRLLENPNLLEHERFTDLLWAVFHLAEELDMRGESFENLPESDYAHLAVDVKRAYSQIASEWLAYAFHLKQSYPFLFSLVARVNPFGPQPSPIVRS